MTIEKSALRKSMLVQREAVPHEALRASGDAIARYGIEWLLAAGAPNRARVSTYRPIGAELSPLALEQVFVTAGWGLCLPVMVGQGQPLQFRSFEAGDELEAVTWGILQPRATAPLVEPDVLLVPLVAFDARGNRLGYGGGYYDRTLAALRSRRSIIAVGLGLDEQRIDAVPHCDYDQRLNWALTPAGPARCS